MILWGHSASDSKLMNGILPADIEPMGDSLDQAIEKIEKNIILKILEKNQWQKNKTSSALKINRKTLFRKMKKYGLE